MKLRALQMAVLSDAASEVNPLGQQLDQKELMTMRKQVEAVVGQSAERGSGQ